MAKLSPEQVEQIEAWAEKGKSGQWIARKLDLKPATVNYRMLRAGFDPWPGHTGKGNAGQPGAFTPEEDVRMLELNKTLSVYRIATTMQRPITSIRIRLMTLEVRAENAVGAA